MIQIKNIVKNYLSGDNVVHALKDVSINFRDSEFVSILGPSGCGKTTLLNIIGGLDKYTSGDIIINGVSTKEFKDKDWDAYRNHYIGFVFQSYNLISHLSVLENVELALSIAGLSKSERREKAIKALKEVGLENQIKKKPNQLSGGQMQRVAIARAIVNEPKIILADEPTGALDSKSSIQVMDILKKMSEKYLVIMVTHNEKIAKEYSTRIISLLDGALTDDTNKYEPSQEEINNDYKNVESNEKNLKSGKKAKKIKTSMSYFTSFMLSLKNLWSKKGKTIIESFAGSIGIIGIALVLAVSAGFNNYIDNLQTNTLGGYPLTISTITVNYNALSDISNQENYNEDIEDGFYIYDSINSITRLGHFNHFSEEFLEYIDDYKQNDVKDYIKSLQYDYNLPIRMLTKQQDSGSQISYISNNTTSSALSGSTNSNLFELIDAKDWILENYNLIGNYANEANELMLVLGSDNKLDISTVKNLGLPYNLINSLTREYDSVSYQDVINNCEYALLLNNGYYKFEDGKYKPITLPNEANSYDNSYITTAFNSAKELSDFNVENDGILKMRISGVLVAKKDIDMEFLNTGLAYTTKLTNLFYENAKKSDIVLATETAIQNNITAGKEGDEIYNIDLPWKYSISVSELKSYLASYGMEELANFEYESTSAIVSDVSVKMKKTISFKQAYELSLQTVGASSTPFSLKFYPTSFDAKQDLIDYISTWNNSNSGALNRIVYSDLTGILTNSMGELIDIISYILIAFAAISLVVSSIMIGIITYTSVIERTKEIGVLRSVGARKKDISRIFTSETIIIGLFAGLIGVFVSYLLTFAISAIIISIAGGAITTSMAILEPMSALILVVISTLLTTIAGTIPAKIASNKDPVKCLRTE